MKSQHNLYAPLALNTSSSLCHPHNLFPQRHCDAVACWPQPLISFSHALHIFFPPRLYLSLQRVAPLSSYPSTRSIYSHADSLVPSITLSNNPLHRLLCLFVSYLAPTHMSVALAWVSFICFAVHDGIHSSDCVLPPYLANHSR